MVIWLVIKSPINSYKNLENFNNNTATVPNEAKLIEHDKEIHKERYTSLEERQKVIDDLRLIWYHNNGISKNNTFVK